MGPLCAGCACLLRDERDRDRDRDRDRYRDRGSGRDRDRDRDRDLNRDRDRGRDRGREKDRDRFAPRRYVLGFGLAVFAQLVVCWLDAIRLCLVSS